MTSPILDEWTSDDGQHRIILGDSTKVLPAIDTSNVTCILTDPPYGILNLNGDNNAIRKSPRANGSGKLKNRMINTASFEWDTKPPTADELKMLRGIGTAQIFWGSNYLELPPTRCVLVWDKCQPWENFSQVEIAWTSLDRPAAIFKFDKSFPKKHPTQKPLPLMSWCLKFLPAGIVLDPYAGACTVAVACAREGRGSISIESDRAYFDEGVSRMKREAARHPLLEPPKPKQLTLLESQP